MTTPVSATTPAIVVAASICSFGIVYGLTSLAIDGTYLDGKLGSDLYDLIYPPIEMTAAGNHIDTGIQKDYERYEDQQKCAGKIPLDKCKWLKVNRNKYNILKYKKIAKAWGCDHSRHSKDKKKSKMK